MAFMWRAVLTLGLVLLYYCFSIGITFYNKWLTKVHGGLRRPLIFSSLASARASASQAGSQSTPVGGQGLSGESPEIPGWRGIRKGGDWGVNQGKRGGSEGPSNTAEAPEPAARPAGVGALGARGGQSRRRSTLCLDSPELPLPPLHDNAALGRDLPVLCPVQGPGSVLQPQGPRGAELARLPQKSGSHRYVPACGPEGGGSSEGKEGMKLSPSRVIPLCVLPTPTASWGVGGDGGVWWLGLHP